jgi:hypothetical protein
MNFGYLYNIFPYFYRFEVKKTDKILKKGEKIVGFKKITYLCNNKKGQII